MRIFIKSSHLLVYIILMLFTHILGLVKFTLPKTDMVHTKSGLILHYLSEYHPANKIITFTVSLPMYADMCFLIPNIAMGKIPDCQSEENTIRQIRTIKEEVQNNKTLFYVKAAKKVSLEVSLTSTERNNPTTQSLATLNPTSQSGGIRPRTPSNSTVISYVILPGIKEIISGPRSSLPHRRRKRLLPAILAIGAGIASTTLSAVNLFQMGSLKSEMKGIKESLRSLQLVTLDNQAQLLHFQEGQYKIAKELADTQKALNKTIDLVNHHSALLRVQADAIRSTLAEEMFLKSKLDAVTRAIDTHFIHESMEQILSNQLNLHFIHHTDIPQVVQLITRAMNLSISEFNTSIPMIEVITRLLVRQQIDFAPRVTRNEPRKGDLIGKIMFTSYFAAPDQRQSPFSIYEVVPIPFNQGKRRMRLANMPAYLGIESISQQFIRWSTEEAVTCKFEEMSSCRESPVRRKESEDDCIYQILTDLALTDCRTETFPEKVFIRRVGQHWAISTYNRSKCHSVTGDDLDQHILIENEEITLPEVVLIKADDEKALACDRFIIPRAPIKNGEPINLIINESVIPSNKPLIDLQDALANETHWEKLPYISSDMQVILDFISSTPKHVSINEFKSWTDHPISFTMFIIVGALISIIIILLVWIYLKKKTNGSSTNITISMPSMKELLAKEKF